MLILNITDPPSFITIQLYGLPANIICMQCLCSLINSDLVKTEYLIYSSKERETRRCVWTWGLALSPAQGPIDLIGGWWHWLSSGSKWIRSLTQWAQERDGPPPVPGSRLVASCQAALSSRFFFFPPRGVGGYFPLTSYNMIIIQLWWLYSIISTVRLV